MSAHYFFLLHDSFKSCISVPRNDITSKTAIVITLFGRGQNCESEILCTLPTVVQLESDEVNFVTGSQGRAPFVRRLTLSC